MTVPALQISPATIVAEFIITDLTSMTNPLDNASWPLYVSHMPDGDDIETDSGMVKDAEGESEGKLMSGDSILHPGVQLQIRSIEYNAGFGKIETIALALDEVAGNTINISGSTYQLDNVHRMTPIKYEGKRRVFLFTVNFLLTLKKIV